MQEDRYMPNIITCWSMCRSRISTKSSKTLTNDLIMGQHDHPRYFFVREITRLTPPRRQNNEEATAEPRFHPLSLDQWSVAMWQLNRPCWGSSSIWFKLIMGNSYDRQHNRVLIRVLNWFMWTRSQSWNKPCFHDEWTNAEIGAVVCEALTLATNRAVNE